MSDNNCKRFKKVKKDFVYSKNKKCSVHDCEFEINKR